MANEVSGNHQGAVKQKRADMLVIQLPDDSDVKLYLDAVRKDQDGGDPLKPYERGLKLWFYVDVEPDPDRPEGDAAVQLSEPDKLGYAWFRSEDGRLTWQKADDPYDVPEAWVGLADDGCIYIVPVDESADWVPATIVVE